MASTATATATATMTTTTHRCNSCNTHPSFTTQNCPACNSPISLNPNPNPNQLHDNYGLTSPHFQRLITHYYYTSSKSTVKSIPTITITPAFLATDPTILCAICKEQFLTNDQTKQLPCKHVYHSQCILPWLSSHTSCPLCRFQLPQQLVHATANSTSMDEGLDDETMLRIGFDNLDDQMYLEPVFDVGSRNVAFPYDEQVIRECVEIDDFQLFMDGDGQLERERVLPRLPNSGVDEGSGVGGEQDGIARWDVWADTPFSVNILGL